MSRLQTGLASPLHRLATGSRVVVTGGAGFVGSHLCDELLRRGCRVHAVDDLSTGRPGNLAPDPGLRLTVASVAEPEVARRLCGDADLVFHLAGVVGVQRLAAAPVEVMRRNLRCTEAVLDAAAAAGVPLLLASSSEVYGDGPVPFRERDPVRPGVPEGPRGGYAFAKAMGEWLAFAHRAGSGWPVAVVRLFNTVGPRQTGEHGMVLPRFVDQALRGEPITVFGDGAQTRCFAHVREVVRALADLVGAPGIAGRVVNVGSDQETSIAELAAIVQRAAGTSAPIVRLPLTAVFPAGFVDPSRRRPCLERLRAAIGWAPSIPVAGIVEELVALGRATSRPVTAASCPGPAS
ncbi:MAG: NAD-dependent epimerase/dehydratase family protein [Planctomycetes bacterium]|nr:NAD-dependent epimerase/dehydratase family protein [Planctomycetota bacterium]